MDMLIEPFIEFVSLLPPFDGELRISPSDNGAGMVAHGLPMSDQVDNPLASDLQTLLNEFLQFLEMCHLLKLFVLKQSIIQVHFIFSVYTLNCIDYKQDTSMMDDCSLPVELYFSARKLKDLDFFSKSDPFLTFSMQRSFHGNIDKIGRTETAPNTVNPNWKQKITAQYYFENKQPVVIEVYDDDSTTSADFIGKAETTMGNIMGSHQQTMIIEIKDHHGKATGKVIIRAEKVQKSSHELHMNWKGGKIANVDSMFDFWDKSDPYLKFLKVRQDNTFIEVARTQVLFNNQSPNWKPVNVPLSKLVDPSNPNPSFKVECWDHEDKAEKHQFIGEIFVSVADLKNKPCPQEFIMTSPKIKKPGKLILNNCSLVPTPNFLDYLNSGLQMNLVVAIDFTASNGNPAQSSSLHYMGNQPNQYQQVIKGIWDIIENYDSDKRIPAFGFGAKPHFPNINTNTANHCFPINDNPHNPEIQGFNELMNTYSQAISNLELAGPTYFAPILKEAFSAAKNITQGYSYQILLILTDGEIHDMAATKDLIVQNANLPTSIVIVGVGNSDFGNMEELDGDGKGLHSSQGQRCPRDIVQFVPYQKFNGNPQILTSELLREIPSQVTQYFKLIGRVPQPAQKANMESVMASQGGQSMTEAIFKSSA